MQPFRALVFGECLLLFSKTHVLLPCNIWPSLLAFNMSTADVAQSCFKNLNTSQPHSCFACSFLVPSGTLYLHRCQRLS
jgi:hypothetical protein